MIRVKQDLHQAQLKELEHYKRKFLAKVETFNKVFQLDDYFKIMIGNKNRVRIADLGCGLLSTTGSTCPGVIVGLYPSDFIADRYNRLFERYKVKRVIPIEKQDMEHLTYDDGFFDIVNCVNALDHTTNPDVAILEMVRVLKPGGYIYLRHQVNTAIVQRYNGLHQWNIEPKDGDCRFYTEAEEFWLSQIVPGFVTSRSLNKRFPEHGLIVSVYKKPLYE